MEVLPRFFNKFLDLLCKEEPHRCDRPIRQLCIGSGEYCRKLQRRALRKRDRGQAEAFDVLSVQFCELAGAAAKIDPTADAFHAYPIIGAKEPEGMFKIANPDAQFWKDLRAEFLEYADDDPTLTAWWRARFGRWQLMSGPLPSEKAHPRVARRFKAMAARAVVKLSSSIVLSDAELWQLGYTTNETEPWEEWLNRMRKAEYNCTAWGSPIAVTERELEGIKAGKSLTAVRTQLSREEAAESQSGSAKDSKGEPVGWLQDAKIDELLKESARLCADLAHEVELSREAQAPDSAPIQPAQASKAAKKPGRPAKEQTSVICAAWVRLGRPKITSRICDGIAKEMFREELKQVKPGSLKHKRVRERVRQAILRGQRRAAT